jgi:hypothetical protein
MYTSQHLTNRYTRSTYEKKNTRTVNVILAAHSRETSYRRWTTRIATIWGSNNGNYECCHLLRYKAMWVRTPSTALAKCLLNPLRSATCLASAYLPHLSPEYTRLLKLTLLHSSCIHMFSQTSHFTLLPSTRFPLVCMGSQARKSGEAMRIILSSLYNCYPGWQLILCRNVLHANFLVAWFWTLKMEMICSCKM